MEPGVVLIAICAIFGAVAIVKHVIPAPSERGGHRRVDETLDAREQESLRMRAAQMERRIHTLEEILAAERGRSRSEV